MARIDYLTSKLASKVKLPEEFFDEIMGPPVYAFFTPQEVEYIRKMMLRNRNDVKIKELNNIMRSRGFARLSGGTNRIVYRHLEDPSFVMKVAIDRVGMNDSNREFKNQQFLKPYVCKIFDSTPCGTMSTVERVYPITSKEEFQSVSTEVFYLIVTKLIGLYVAEDIGKNYFRNYGIRPGFGVVLLDYPYFYRVDESKLFCTAIDPDTNTRCTGLIDYDAGFNHLFCTKCGRRYLAVDLEDKNPNNDPIIFKGGKYPMKVTLMRGNKEVAAPIRSSNTMVNTRKVEKSESHLKVSLSGGNFSKKEEVKKAPKVEPAEKKEEKTYNLKAENPVFATPAPVISISETIKETIKDEVKKEIKKELKDATKQPEPEKKDEAKVEEKAEDKVEVKVEEDKSVDKSTKLVDLRPSNISNKDYSGEYEDLEDAVKERPKTKKAAKAKTAGKGTKSNFIPDDDE